MRLRLGLWLVLALLVGIISQPNGTAIGFGQEQPIADNSTAGGRTANRRVELKVSREKH